MSESASTSVTSPMNVEFTPVSPQLATARLVGAAIFTLVPALVAVVLALVLSQPLLYIIVGVGVVLFLWMLWMIPRQVRAIGYATAESDFMVRKGIMFRSLVVVPYGRIQYVDVNEGPVARKLGIASIQLHTASAQTDASLDGLPAPAAADLRDLLVKGGARLSGI